MTALAAAAVWLQPVLLAVLVLRVAAGAADAAWLALGVLVAPLVALLVPGRRTWGLGPVTRAALAGAVTLVLAADLVVAADVALLLGASPWLGVAAGAALALVVPLLPGAARVSPVGLALVALALLLPLVSIAATTATPPWTAWSRGALRPALTFAPSSGWVGAGERFARAERLAFTEGQRVTAVGGGVFRVIEHDASPPTVREWRLEAGESLTLRPGDELTVEAGARLRFEPGRRVPGAPVSGIAWADAPVRAPGVLGAALGALVTLVGGALAVVPGARRGVAAMPGPLVLLVATTAAIGWGVYTAAAAPDLALGGSMAAPMLGLPVRALGPRTGAPLAVLAIATVASLFLTAVIGLRGRLATAIGPRPMLWAAAVGAASLVTALGSDPWRLLLLGLGLAASTCVPALLAPGRSAGEVGSGVGALVFTVLAVLPVLAPAVAALLTPLVAHPALAALPLGWLAARALGGVLADAEKTPPVVR